MYFGGQSGCLGVEPLLQIFVGALNTAVGDMVVK